MSTFLLITLATKTVAERQLQVASCRFKFIEHKGAHNSCKLFTMNKQSSKSSEHFQISGSCLVNVVFVSL